MMQGNLHASEGGMFMGHEETMSAMKDGVSNWKQPNFILIDNYHFA